MNLISLIKRGVSIKDIFYFIQGNIRYKIYYSSKLRGLLREHIVEQITYRIRVMRQDCYENGSCVECGCMTTNLQMCSKSCEGQCYPPMMTKDNWNKKVSSIVIIKQGNTSYRGFWVWENNKYNLYKETPTSYVKANIH